MLGPLLPLYLRALDAEPGQIGLVFGVGNIAAALLILPAGLLADRFGRRLVIIASGGSGFLGAITLLPLTHWEGAFVSSILYWVSTAALPVMSAHVASIASRAVLGRSMGMVYGSFFVGFIVASPFAGAVAARIGLPSTIALAAAFFGLSAAGGVLLSAGRVAATAQRGRFPRAFWVLLALTPLGSFVAVLSTPLLPVYVRDVVGSPLELVGVYVACLSLGSAALSAVAGRVADRFGPVSAVLANAAILTAGCAIAAFLTGSGLAVAIGLTLAGANVASNPVLAALLERVVPVARAAVGYAAFQLVYAAGFGVGGIAAGALYDTDPRLPFLVTAALALPVAAVVCIAVARIARAPAPAMHAP